MKVEWQGNLYEERVENHITTYYALDTILAPYFQNATWCRTGKKTPFTINFHSGHPEYPTTYGRTVEIPAGPPIGGSTFYEYPHYSGLSVEPESPNIRLIYNKKLIGILCPEQVLWASAWTHMDEYLPLIEHIVTYLADQELLIKSPPRAKKEPIKKATFGITLGGDPEFELIDSDGHFVTADDIGIDLSEDYGNVGVDGSGDQVELRPSPGSPEDVVENIRKLLELFGFHHGEEYKLTASSTEFPCGGHIHIGVNPLPHSSYYRRLTNVLDDFIGKPTERLNGPTRGKNNDGEYGRIGDWREQDYGMEYRTPPSSVWGNPELTRVVLKLTYNLAVQLANNLSIEYETPVGHSILVEVGGLTDEEANYYINECGKKPPHKEEYLLAAWNIETVPPKPRIKIKYEESWSGEIKRLLNQEFKDKEFKDKEVTENITVTFYGLKEERGNVFTFKLPSREKISHPNMGTDNTWFGFSYRFRRGSTTSSEIKTVVKAIYQQICDLQAGKIPLCPPVEETVVEEQDVLEETADSAAGLVMSWEPVPSSSAESAVEYIIPTSYWNDWADTTWDWERAFLSALERIRQDQIEEE